MRALLVMMAFALGAALPVRAQVANTMSYQGYLTDADGEPVENPNATLTFRIYEAQTGGEPIWTETRAGVAVEEGVFSVLLGEIEPLDPEWFDAPLWLSVALGSEEAAELEPRIRLAAAPLSLMARALDADALQAGDNISIQKEGHRLVISAEVSGEEEEGGDITSVTAGAGLVGGGEEGDVTLSLAPQIFINPTIPYVGIGRSTRITGEYFGVNAPVTSGSTGGIYVNTNEGGRPVYGYAINNVNRAQHYFDPTTSSWRLQVGGFIALAARSNGRVGIGTNDPQASLHVSGGSLMVGGTLHMLMRAQRLSYHTSQGERGYIDFGSSAIQFTNAWPNGSIVFRTGGQNRLVLESNGEVYPGLTNAQNLGRPANRWLAVWALLGAIQTSDRRLKRDIKDLRYGLTEVRRLRPVSYRWRDQEGGVVRLGLIAQEVQEVVPEAVQVPDEPDGMLGMNYGDLVPVLIKAIQEQQAQIDALQREVDGLSALSAGR